MPRPSPHETPAVGRAEAVVSLLLSAETPVELAAAKVHARRVMATSDAEALSLGAAPPPSLPYARLARSAVLRGDRASASIYARRAHALRYGRGTRPASSAPTPEEVADALCRARRADINDSVAAEMAGHLLRLGPAGLRAVRAGLCMSPEELRAAVRGKLAGRVIAYARGGAARYARLARGARSRGDGASARIYARQARGALRG